MNDTKTFHVIYHAEPSYWAEVPELAGFSAADENLFALRDKVRQVVHELCGTHVDLDERFAPALVETESPKPDGARHFVGRPSEIDAMQYDGTNINEIVSWVNEHRGEAKVGYGIPGPDKVQPLFLYVHGKPNRINQGTWVVRDDGGWFSAVTSSEFEGMYEEVIDGSH